MVKETSHKGDNRTAYLSKRAEGANFVESADIRNVDRISLNRNHFPTLIELTCDRQNIPKWWLMVFNWGSDITLSLTWALSWAKFREVDRKRLEAEKGQSDFLSLAPLKKNDNALIIIDQESKINGFQCRRHAR